MLLEADAVEAAVFRLQSFVIPPYTIIRKLVAAYMLSSALTASAGGQRPIVLVWPFLRPQLLDPHRPPPKNKGQAQAMTIGDNRVDVVEEAQTLVFHFYPHNAHDTERGRVYEVVPERQQSGSGALMIQYRRRRYQIYPHDMSSCARYMPQALKNTIFFFITILRLA